MKRVYLFLAIVGAVLPYIFFIRFFSIEGANLGDFILAPFVNGAAAGFAVDLLFTSIVFWLFMFIKRSKGEGPNPWVFVLLNLTIGLSCAVPAYLYTTTDR
jgi:hypothetical protein